MDSQLSTLPSVPVSEGTQPKPLFALPALQKSIATFEASRLIQLGARAGLVSHLTGIDKCTANRLYRQIHGRPSPPGQTPFTDTWFLRNDRRMLHAAVIWRLHKQLNTDIKRAGRTLIDVFEAYRLMLPRDHFDITHVAFVPKLLEMNVWHERICSDCGSLYPIPVENPGTTCPGCRLQKRYRCLYCGAAAEGDRAGRRRAVCPDCGASRQL